MVLLAAVAHEVPISAQIFVVAAAAVAIQSAALFSSRAIYLQADCEVTVAFSQMPPGVAVATADVAGHG